MARSKNFFFGKLLKFDPARGSYSLKSEVGDNVDDTTARSLKDVENDMLDSDQVENISTSKAITMSIIFG